MYKERLLTGSMVMGGDFEGICSLRAILGSLRERSFFGHDRGTEKVLS